MLELEAYRFDTDLESMAIAFPEHERAEFYDSHVDDYIELADELPSMLRYSVLTRADSALEAYLVSSRYLQGPSQAKRSAKGFRGEWLRSRIPIHEKVCICWF
jgi:hypothetical protein